VAVTVTLAEIREGLAANLRQHVEGLRIYPRWQDNVEAPGAIIMLDAGHYHRSMGETGHTDHTFQVLVLAAGIDNGYERAEEALEPYLDPNSPRSIKTALESDKTLGGIVSTLNVTRWHEIGEPDMAGIGFWSAKVEVEVFT
jgi:hypothetical protein